MTPGQKEVIKVIGVALATFLFVHFGGIHYGLLGGAAFAMIELP